MIPWSLLKMYLVNKMILDNKQMSFKFTEMLFGMSWPKTVFAHQTWLISQSERALYKSYKRL